MKLTVSGIRERASFENAGIRLPAYDVAAVRENTIRAPQWAHFGIGNIFRIFMGGIADDLIESGELTTGISCIETFDYDVVDKIYDPYDNLALAVTLLNDGTCVKRVLGSLAEAVAVRPGNQSAYERLEELFCSTSLQMVSFTITEKGYELKDPAGCLLPLIEKDLDAGPDGALTSAMTLVTSLLAKRFHAGACPLSLVCMRQSGSGNWRVRVSRFWVRDRSESFWHRPSKRLEPKAF